MPFRYKKSNPQTGFFTQFSFLNAAGRLCCLLFLSLLFNVRAVAQPLVCVDAVQIALDFECKDTVHADEVLEGSYCCYDNYAVEIDKTPGGTDCDGIWDSNILYATDIGMTYCFRVSDLFSSDVCYGFVTVVDNIAPTISCPLNQTRNTDPGVCTYTAVGGEFDPSYSDNCIDAALSWMLSGKTGGTGTATLAGKAFNRGNATTVKWTATDQGSNSATCTFTVTVADQEAPTIACPADQARNTDPGQCDYTTVGTEFDPTAYGDNCPGVGLNYSLTGAVNWNGPGSLAGFVFPVGQTTVTWVATDPQFYADCTFTITVNGAGAPGVTCPAAQSRNTDPGVCTYTSVGMEFDPLSVTNSCSGSPTLAYTLSGVTTGSGTTTLAGKVFQKGQTTVTWTATDAGNQSATCSFTITVSDAQPPSIACLTTQNRNANAGICTYTAVGAEFNPTSFGDNCPGASLAYVLSGVTSGSGTNTLAGQVFQKGQTLVVWTVTDGANNSASCSFNVIVKDGQGPTITCPGTQNRNANAGGCTYAAAGAEFDPTSFGDNCTGSSIAYTLSGATSGSGVTTLAGIIFQKSQTTVVWTVTDAGSNTATCSFLVIVKDVQNPTIACPGAQNRNANASVCTYTAVGTEFDPTSFGDNCAGANLSYALSGATSGSGATTLAGVVFQKGQTTITWTITDAGGNPASCSFVVTVVDNQGPGIGCPGAQNRNTNSGVCTYTAVGTEFNPAFFNDNCPGAGIAYALSGATTGSGATTLAGVVFQKGQTTVTWTVTDAVNLIKTCSFTVTVNDNQPPTIVCPGAQTRNTNPGVCNYTAVGAEFNPATLSDNCPGLGAAWVLTGATAGSGATTLAGTVFNKGVTLVNWTATDAANLTAVCAFNVTVNDGQAPTVTCPANQTRKTDPNLCTYTALGTEFNPLSVSGDNCPGAVTIAYNLSGATSGSGPNTLAGKVFQKGQTTVTWTATDAAGNPGTCSFVVTVNDLQNPAITCPGNQNRNTNNGVCTYTAVGAELDPLAASDNCPGPISFAYALNGATSGTGSGTLAGKVFNKGQTFIAWTAIDASGNPWTCNFILTVQDAQPPLLLCPLNQTRNTNTSVCTYTVVGGEFNTTFTDNCPGATIAYVLTGATTGNGPTTLAGKVFNKGITTVKWTATDAANNTASCAFTVDVKDAQAPTVTCPANQTRSTLLNVCYYIATGTEFDPTSLGDNCPGSVGYSYLLTGATSDANSLPLAGTVFNKGLTTVKWTATDFAGNTATCTFTVDVKDNQPPKFSFCPPVALYNANMTPGCTITIPSLLNLPNAAATDNCPGLTKTQSPAAGTVMTVTHNQNVPVVITAKDAAGNTATCNRIVKAKDVTAPTILTCPPNRTVSLSPDCKITVPDMRGEVVATDCSLPLTVTQNPAQGTVLPSDAGDVFAVTMTVKDVAGNAKTCTVVLTAEFRYFAYIAN